MRAMPQTLLILNEAADVGFGGQSVRDSDASGFCRNFRLFIYLEQIPPALRPLTLGEYFLRFFVRIVFTRHFDLARGHLIFPFIGDLRRGLGASTARVISASARRQGNRE